ncbi:hypothetical protein DFS34DRAFT_620310 [Phlyctochytrium arcticum]|nr:hypothetical protein DFS34DRAFT_620310 [Phlyctochytrium arcticum]
MPKMQESSSTTDRLRAVYAEAFQLAQAAVAADSEGQIQQAKTYYEEASQRILLLLQLETTPEKVNQLHSKWEEYALRTKVFENALGRTGRRLARATSLYKYLDFNHDLLGHEQMFNDTEIDILKKSSLINGLLFLPWLERDCSDVESERKVFSDPDGFLRLSVPQKVSFKCWKRFGEIVPNCRMIQGLKEGSIVQDAVADCSLVASLCVASEYERNFNVAILTNRIFPQDAKGSPVINSNGKYLVKLIWNGVARKVVVDDFFPVSSKNNLLCTRSLCGDLWPSILEKAYLKLQGGYGFPGSNSGVDLHSLTGWIPEDIFLEQTDLDIYSLFRRLQDGFLRGMALVTLGTGSTLTTEARAMGLIAGHAYAFIGITSSVDKSFNASRRIKIQNPWRRNQATANVVNEKNRDIFWIDWKDIRRLFQTIHINWNPTMWTYRRTVHGTWPLAQDRRAHGPQYVLSVDVLNDAHAAIWIHLTRHTMTTQVITDYITFHIYPGPIIDDLHAPLFRGKYVNNQHHLTRFIAPRGKGSFVIMLSTHTHRAANVNFSITAYSMSFMNLEPAVDCFVHKLEVPGSWTPTTAGGSMNGDFYSRNPRFILSVEEPTSVILTLRVIAPYSINLKVYRDGVQPNLADPLYSSGDYRRESCSLRVSLSRGVYTVVPSTFEAHQIASFSLHVQSQSFVKVCSIENFHSKSLPQI